MARFILFLAALLALALPATPARADDITVAGRSVVRVVVIVFGEEGEVVNFGHGSGFAVGRNRIVTNSHVVAQAQQAGQRVAVGVVPSEGNQAYRARVVAADPARDLALLEVDDGTFQPIPLFVGPLDDGAPIAALGYPGNVDLATARSANDFNSYVTPLPPTRSVGIFSNVRPISGITTLLHTANIARGHSGGPLLDQCGRVLGVNTLITRNQDGDAPFAFAVANRELAAFLARAGQPFQSTVAECVSMADRLRQDRERTAAEERSRQQAAAEAAQKARDTRERSLAEIEQMRDNRLALAVLLLVFAMLSFGGGGIAIVKNRPKPAWAMGALGVLLLAGAIVAFFSRPSLVEARAAEAREGVAAPDRFAGRNLCRLVADRSRITVSATGDVPLAWSATGCVNGRTQYARDGDVWTRILVPNEQQAVAVSQFRPATGEYVISRYQLDRAGIERVRAVHREGEPRACMADGEARTLLAARQRDVVAMLPPLPNERLVYQCEAAPGGR